jgi:hypothetical protein
MPVQRARIGYARSKNQSVAGLVRRQVYDRRQPSFRHQARGFPADSAIDRAPGRAIPIPTLIAEPARGFQAA